MLERHYLFFVGLLDLCLSNGIDGLGLEKSTESH